MEIPVKPQSILRDTSDPFRTPKNKKAAFDPSTPPKAQRRGSKSKYSKPLRSLSAVTVDSAVMKALSIEELSVVDTPLSANRSCSEYNRVPVYDELNKSNKTVEKPKSFFSSFFSWSSSTSTPVKSASKVRFNENVEEQRYFVDSFRFNQSNLMEDEMYDYSVKSEPGCISMYSNTPMIGCSTADHPDARHQAKKRTNSTSGSASSVFYESAVALDYIFGFNPKVRDLPMEIELKNLKEPQLLSVYHSISALDDVLSERDSIVELNRIPSSHSADDPPVTLGIRRVTSLRSFERIGEGSNNVNTINSEALAANLNNIFAAPMEDAPFDWRNMETWGPAFLLQWKEYTRQVRGRFFGGRNDDLFYENCRIQPFSCGAYLRGMLWAGFCSLFFNMYNLVCWSSLVQSAGMTPYHNNFETFLFAVLLFQLALNMLQLPARLQIHFQCWDSSRAVEVDVAITVLRNMIASDSWVWNRVLGTFLDGISLFFLLACEVYLWLTPQDDPLHTLIVALCATNLLTFVSRIVVATAFSLAIHDPQVLSDARKRGLSKWDLDVLPTFLFSSSDEVNNEDCSICLGSFDIGEMLISLPCDKKHSFHAVCIRQWLQRQNSCPLCQKLV